MSTSISRSLLLSSIFAGALAALGAREKLDLERIVPVGPTETIPIADFFRPRLLQSPSLNRSGTHMAALVTVGKDRHDLLIHDFDKKGFETLHAEGDKDIYSFTWLNDQRLVYMLSADKHYAVGMMALDVKNLSGSFSILQYCGPQLVAIPEKNRLRPLIWMRFDMEDSRDQGVAEIDTDVRTPMFNLERATANDTDFRMQRDNNLRHVVRAFPVPPGIGSGYLADGQGELAYAFYGKDGVITLYRYERNAWVPCPVDLDVIGVEGTSDNPGELVVRGARQEGKPRPLQLMTAATGEAGAVLIQDKAYDFNGWLVRDVRSRRIVGAKYYRAALTSVWFDEGYRALQKTLEASFPKQVVQILDVDLSGRILVETFTDRQPPIYHRVDLEKKVIGLIKNSAPWIDPARMQPTNVIAFKTRDGRKLDAYFTLPAGASKQNPAPLVVLPHGGPWVRDTWGFDGEAQFLASRGYAVLQPNYRGSEGYDWMFPEEDRYAFVKMHEDVTDAAKMVAASGYVDPKRMAIMGGSFGGYLALSGVTREPDLYRCAVTIAGVFDWERVMQADKFDQYYTNGYAYLKRKLGDPAKEREKFAAMSPIHLVNQVRVPVFVSHGTDDYVAEVAESKRLISELNKYHVPNEVLLVRGEGHGMGHLTNQVELYSRIEAFLAKNLAPVAEPTTAAGSH
jgi:acetyl esterase/lipase